MGLHRRPANQRLASRFFLYLRRILGVVRTSSLAQLLSSYLGVEYRQRSSVWTHYVAPNPWASGWYPHVDGPGKGKRLSLWIPLTDASLDNGCMYVIPRDRVPESLPRAYTDWERASIRERERILHGVRPLPATAGSILGWEHDLIHWGGRARESAIQPRVSMAVEFLDGSVTPEKRDVPVFDPLAIPSFQQRLQVIGQAILSYQKFEPILNRYRSLAARLIEFSSGQGGSIEFRRGHSDFNPQVGH